jgi:hypothetical protein
MIFGIIDFSLLLSVLVLFIFVDGQQFNKHQQKEQITEHKTRYLRKVIPRRLEHFVFTLGQEFTKMLARAFLKSLY